MENSKEGKPTTVSGRRKRLVSHCSLPNITCKEREINCLGVSPGAIYNSHDMSHENFHALCVIE